MRLVGLDISGWLDVAARDWDIDDTDDAREAAPTIRILDGGAGSVAIRDNNGRWIGGPQAILAPHGLGAGWGEIGAPERRIGIGDCLNAIVSGQTGVPLALAAAVEGLGRHAESHVLNVPDLPEMDEGARGRLLNVFPRRMRPPRLLWRPVALFLEALRAGRISKADIGRQFGFIIHSSRGLELQTLRLREDREHAGHFAPERDGYGSLIGLDIGLERLCQSVHSAIRSANRILDDRSFGPIEIAPRLLAGRIEPGSKHVVRENNGVWIELKAPDSLALFQSDGWAVEAHHRLSGCGPLKTVFFATPLASPYADEILEQLRRKVANVERVDWQDLAMGALSAGRTIERGLPHYFDRLTPISLAVFQGNEPIFTDLIGERDTLPANKEFVSRPYRDLEWPASKNKIEFFVLKGEAEIRHWVVSMTEAPDHVSPVELVLRQTPGQSWAKLLLSSSAWELLQRNPISLNWDDLQPLPESADEVLQRLRKPPPTIPHRIVERAHRDFWFGAPRLLGIIDVIERGAGSAGEIAKLLNRRMKTTSLFDEAERVWPIGTDGELPTGLSDSTVAAFDTNIASIAAVVAKAVKTGRPRSSNDELRCLTWMFTRCPDGIQTDIVEALEADLAEKRHPFLVPSRAKTVLVQGAGRAVTGEERIRRVLKLLTAGPPHADTKPPNNNTFAALAMILARRKEAPLALNETLVAGIAKIVSVELKKVVKESNAKRFRVRFKNALSALAGLFRYREVQPYALLRNESKVAGDLSADLEKINKALSKAGAKVPQVEEKIELVGELLKLLEGQGDPNILRKIEGADDEGQDDAG